MEHCDFRTVLSDMLQNRIVCGIRNASLQCGLLVEAEITFKKRLICARWQKQQRPTYRNCKQIVIECS